MFLPSLVPFLLVYPMWCRRDSSQALVMLTWPPCSPRSQGLRCPTMPLAVAMTMVWLSTLPTSIRAFSWLQTWSSSTSSRRRGWPFLEGGSSWISSSAGTSDNLFFKSVLYCASLGCPKFQLLHFSKILLVLLQGHTYI